MEKKIIEEVLIRHKKERINKEQVSERIKNKLLNKKKHRDESKKYISAQSVVKNYRERQKSYSSYKHKIQCSNKFLNQAYDETREHTPLIVIRIAGQAQRIPREIKAILAKIHLDKMYSANILFYNKEALKMIKLIESYVTWGYLKKTRLEELLTKRGSVIIGNNEQNDLDNAQIENALGTFGIFCLEDIIHELSIESKHSKEVLNYLGYFMLAQCDEIKDKVNIAFVKGGNQGFRGDKINSLLKKMI